MRSSYREEDVVLLLKDITGLVEPLPAAQRERQIQSGRHYCEMLPLEYSPTAPYLAAYEAALEAYAEPVADAVSVLAEQLMRQKGPEMVLVSLARAGIPVGILLKRYLRQFYGVDVPHYAISIIRGRGIDHKAMGYLLARYDGAQLQFVDGWTGKGAILRELQKEMEKYPDVSDELAVLADPAAVTNLCGTYEDLLVPSSCLNSTVSGLLSRTFLRADLIGPDDFHGAVCYEELREGDLSYAFIDAITAKFVPPGKGGAPVRPQHSGVAEVQRIAQHFQVRDINLIKPGIGETTRVLLRRVPWKILLRRDIEKSVMVQHLLRLAEEKQVPVEYYPLQNYCACGIIKTMSDI